MSTTSTWNANATASWRDGPFSGWRTDNNYVYQGEWSGNGNHRGCWFFNDANIRSTLSGRNVLSVRFRLTRRSSGGVTGAQTAYFRQHAHSSQPSGMPEWINAQQTPQSWAWGETKWATLPAWWGSRFRDGDARGIMIQVSSGSPYMIFSGTAILEIVHESTLSPPSTPNTPSIVSVGSTSYEVSTNTPANTEEWHWNPQDAGSNFAVRETRFYSQGGRTPGNTYNVRVRAANAAGTSSYSGWRAVLMVPPTPSGVGASTASTTSITISWNSTNGAASYTVDRSGGGTSNTSSTSMTWTGLSPDTTYSFRVRANNSSGSSSYSGWVSAKTALPAPATPGQPSASNVTETSATISWNAVSYAANYDLQHNGTIIRSATTSTSHNITGLADGATHEFRVRARNATAVSSYSSIRTVNTPTLHVPPPTPTNLGPTGVQGPGGVTLAANLPTMASQNSGLVQRAHWHVSKDITFPTNDRYSKAGTEWKASGSVSETVPMDEAVLAQGPGTYYVRARAEHDDGMFSGYSDPVEFTFRRVKVWDGSAWVLRPVLVWSGSAWVEKSLHVFGEPDTGGGAPPAWH